MARAWSSIPMWVYRIVIFTSLWRASSFASGSEAPFLSSSVI